MRKFVSLLMIMVMLILPTVSFAEGPASPDISALWWSVPATSFQLVRKATDFNRYFAAISNAYDINGFNEMVLGTDNYELIEMLIITLPARTRKVTWYMPYDFELEDTVSVFMIAIDMSQAYILTGNINKTHNLVVNYSSIPIGQYFMLIYIAK